MSLETEYLGTTPGRLKCINIVLGLLGVALIGAGHDKHDLTNGPSVFCSPFNDRPCVQIWAADFGMSIVILAWLFSIAMLMGSLSTRFKNDESFMKLDFWGHVIFGVALILASIFILIYIITSLQTICTRNFFDYHLQGSFGNRQDGCVTHLITNGKYLWIFGMIFAACFAVTIIWTSVVLGRLLPMRTDLPVTMTWPVATPVVVMSK